MCDDDICSALLCGTLCGCCCATAAEQEPSTIRPTTRCCSNRSTRHGPPISLSSIRPSATVCGSVRRPLLQSQLKPPPLVTLDSP
ncbi:hypothetical protein Ae201684P_001223 [Aphanomyces euteiches]|uniref:Uncharacterized protein n=1 Tax=Aphanomyces euteiches TaxID=100861 RepID=A0A6G0WGK4_9STRA|nr:hypothetical protein Ae201684_015390 [Aphanomyces euteiches]KAH9097747.1 hypothetical protein Ae201684P_001223 [Aphanomyces euteiches]